MLLFLDQAADTHADWVEAECDRRGVPYVRFCTEQFPVDVQLSIKLNRGALSGRIIAPEWDVPIEDIVGVWHRRPGEIQPHPDLDEAFHRFCLMESNSTLNGLYRALWDRRWVSPPHAVKAANHKVHQLRFAAQMGFETVPTLVTNNPDEVRTFYKACQGQMIYKTLRQVAIAYADGSGHGIYTTKIGADDLEQHIESVRYMPCLFQQLIPKAYELRINVIGDRVWSTAIHTQEHEHTVMDFRPNTTDCRHTPYLLPEKLEKMCLDLTHQLGLRMSNIDLIATPDGEYVFLEINPNGQWAWIEDFVGFPLATALVDELLGVDTLANHPYIKDRALIFEPNTAIKALAEAKQSEVENVAIAGVA